MSVRLRCVVVAFGIVSCLAGSTSASATTAGVATLSGSSLSWVAFDPFQPSTVYVSGTDSPYWRSLDDGLTWNQVSGCAPIVFSSVDANLRYEVCGGWLGRSTDGGATWTGLGTLDHGYALIGITVANDGTLYAATSPAGVAVSRDAGTSWQPYNDGLPSIGGPTGSVAAFAVSPDSQTAYLALTDGSVYRRAPDEAWTLVGSLAADRAGPTSFSVSTGDDQTVTHLLGRDPHVMSYAVSPDNEQQIVVGTEAGIRTSSDGGASWSPLVDVFQGESVNAIAVDPNDSATLVAGLPAGAFRSTDGGQTWTPVNDGIRISTFVQSLATDPTDPSIVYAGTQGGIWRSADGGQTWSYSESGLPPNTTFVGDVTIDPLDTATVFIQARNGYFVSHDHGQTWVSLYPYGTDQGEPVVVDPNDNDHLIIPGGYGYVESFDGGQSFTRTTVCCTEAFDDMEQFERAAIDPQNPATIYLGAKDGVWRSTNGGANWSRVLYLGVPTGTSGYARVLAIDPNDPNTIYFALGWRSLYVSHDGGETWQISYDGEVRALTLDPSTNPTTAYIENNGVYQSLRSSDAGVTWTPADQATGSADALALGEETTVPGLSHSTRTLYEGAASVSKHAFVAATPQATIASADIIVKVIVKNRSAHLTIRCDDGWGARCETTVTLTRYGKTIADRTSSLAAGQQETLTLRLSDAVLRVLHRHPRGILARAYIATTGLDRTLTTDHRRVHLVQP
jgi:photosystem II stability/assembly factor-like uncharacterized protein